MRFYRFRDGMTALQIDILKGDEYKKVLKSKLDCHKKA